MAIGKLSFIQRCGAVKAGRIAYQLRLCIFRHLHEPSLHRSGRPL